ncbi:PREDICTED: uncharacterized protein LOC108523128 isoform X1 [Rhinopithecus bieti]|uniref:uncharacterized protein LOC108523128 isoform X1 n=1 Tax=Rhinopithecus bieti TaxID=61621 RepID=UPI00083BC53C|nr:PREDICTED: uncharacterized protein LOC108523128 isoform X1 [Rhinopithecus bieti]
MRRHPVNLARCRRDVVMPRILPAGSQFTTRLQLGFEPFSPPWSFSSVLFSLVLILVPHHIPSTQIHIQDVMVGATAATLDLRVTAKKRRHMPREETSFCNDTMTYSKTCFL